MLYLRFLRSRFYITEQLLVFWGFCFYFNVFFCSYLILNRSIYKNELSRKKEHKNIRIIVRLSICDIWCLFTFFFNSTAHLVLHHLSNFKLNIVRSVMSNNPYCSFINMFNTNLLASFDWKVNVKILMGFIQEYHISGFIYDWWHKKQHNIVEKK